MSTHGSQTNPVANAYTCGFKMVLLCSLGLASTGWEILPEPLLITHELGLFLGELGAFYQNGSPRSSKWLQDVPISDAMR